MPYLSRTDFGFFMPDGKLNPEVFDWEPNLGGNMPPERRDPNIGFEELWAFEKWYVPERGVGDQRTRVKRVGGIWEDWPVLADGTELGPHSGCQVEVIVRNGKAIFHGHEFELTDYKNRPILAPNYEMWNWYTQRRVVAIVLEDDDDVLNYRERVVFGTKDDRYSEFPEKWGFRNRRSVPSVSPQWKSEANEYDSDIYEERLQRLNPRRGTPGGKSTGRFAPPGRWDEINEESGLRVKHAPSILMKNQYITDYRSFALTYLSGSQGFVRNADDQPIARPDHVTDHELYRMFSGKHRKRILDNALFADARLQIRKPSKIPNTGNPIKALSPNYRFKNQLARTWRIHFRSI